MAHEDERRGNGDYMGYLIAGLLLTVAAIVLWNLFWNKNEDAIKDVALAGAYYLRYLQLPFSLLMTDTYKGVLYNLPNLYHELKGTSYDTAYVGIFAQIALRSVAILFTLAIVPRALYLIINHHRINFSRTMDLHALIEMQREYNPRIKPPTARNLLNEDARFGSWASQMNPIDLIVHHQMIQLEAPENGLTTQKRQELYQGLEDLGVAGLKEPEHYTVDCQPLSVREYANRTFPTLNAQNKTENLTTLLNNIDQYVGMLYVDPNQVREFYKRSLGPLCHYTGKYIDIRFLPPLERALWVIFMACVGQREHLRGRIEALLDQMSDTFVEGVPGSHDHQMDLAGIDELFELAIKETKVKLALTRIARAHGYYYTAFTALYTLAKKNYGTITSRDFHWLKVTNRALYWTINQIGMDRARYETAGIRAHYLAEKKRNYGHGHRITKPQVESAALNLVHHLDIDGWTAVAQTDVDLDENSPTFMQARWFTYKRDNEAGKPSSDATNTAGRETEPA